MLNSKALAASVSAPPAVYIEDVFSTFLYTGTGATQTITNGIDLSGKGGLTWIKGRSGATGHRFTDTARSATKSLASDSTAAEATESTGLTSFSSTGFAIGADADYNTSAATYCSWTFREQPKFFDVVTYTGTGANRTIAHNLGSVPGSIIVKRTDTTADWAVYHRSLANTQYLVLNSTAATATGATWWNSTTPTSSVFSVGTDASVNASGGTYVAYVFAHDAGGFGTAGTDNVVSCGGFTANGSGAATVSLGYEPQWILTKRTNSATSWQIYDNMRGFTADNVAQQALRPDLSSAESGAFPYATNATGFSLTGVNASDTFIYIAIRRGPMKIPTVGTGVYFGSLANPSVSISTGFVPDMAIAKTRDTTGPMYTGTRLQGNAINLRTSIDSAEGGFGWSWDAPSKTFLQSSIASPVVLWAFARAKQFFDVVCYTGTGSNRTISHDLSVIPELIIVKQRNAVRDWAVYANNDNTDYLSFNLNSATIDLNTYWNDTSPTSSVFSVGTNVAVNGSGSTYIAYLFATLAGVSKVGSYTGNGTNQTITCGFTGGARFVMIKRISATGDWYIWDTARGIISGNDPHLSANMNASFQNDAEVTSDDSVDPDSSGFIVNQLSATNVNVSSASYIFLAIA